MDHSDLKFYFDQVLGVRAIYLDPASAQLIQVYVEDFSQYTPEENELFDKIMGAMGLERSAIQISSNPSAENECLILFKNSPSDAAKEISSPRAMLKNPTLKKPAWDKLKKIFVI